MLWRLCAIRSSCEPSGRGGRSAAIRRNRAWNSSFVAVARSNSLYVLMISFVSSHGHRDLPGTEERRRRLAEAGVRRKPRLKQSRRGAFVGKVKDVDGCELRRMKLLREGIRAWCEFQGRPWRVRRSRRAILTPRCSFPQNPLGFRPSGTCLSRVVRANRPGKSVGSCLFRPRNRDYSFGGKSDCRSFRLGRGSVASGFLLRALGLNGTKKPAFEAGLLRSECRLRQG
jgi:hypothetical protein